MKKNLFYLFEKNLKKIQFKKRILYIYYILKKNLYKII